MQASPVLTAILTAGVLAGCTKTAPVPQTLKPKAESAQTLMVRMAKRMQACWFKKKDPAFRKYKLASEVNSYAGRPRVLVVPRNSPTSLPKLVVQAERIGGRNVISSFGPLMQTKDGTRLQSAINRWERGGTACS